MMTTSTHVSLQQPVQAGQLTQVRPLSHSTMEAHWYQASTATCLICIALVASGGMMTRFSSALGQEHLALFQI